VDATAVVMATSATVNGGASGAVTVGQNGKLVVGAGGLTLLNQAVLQATAIENGTLNISNGNVVANRNHIVNTNAGGNGVSTINFIDGGNLELGPNVVCGTVASPIGNLNFNLTQNATFQLDLPSATETNVVVNSLVWPATDSQLTFVIPNLPP